jgi:hypothetical protein
MADRQERGTNFMRAFGIGAMAIITVLVRHAAHLAAQTRRDHMVQARTGLALRPTDILLRFFLGRLKAASPC